MANVILTAEDAYRKFLQGIRKVNNRTVPPDEFESWYTDAMLEWVSSKLQAPEFNQKLIDDMEAFRIVTDGDYYPLITGTANKFSLPVVSDGVSGGKLMSGVYPLYLHGLNAMFSDGAGGFFEATLLKANVRPVTTWNKYRKVTAERPYFEYVEKTIRLLGRDSSGLRLEYYRYPVIISYTNNIDPDTTPVQTAEIIDIAVRKFTENRGDPRYKSLLQEMMLRQQKTN